MLLNAYGWWKVSQIVYIVSLVLFGLGTVAWPSLDLPVRLRPSAQGRQATSRVATRASPRPDRLGSP